MDASSKEIWVGVDWADEEHQVCVVDDDGQVVDAFALPHQAQALNALAARLRLGGRVAGVAIETPRHLIVHQLIAEGFVVYAVNPEVSHKWCKALSVAGASTDPDQAFALADGLRHHHARLRALLPDDTPTRELRLLCEAELDLIEQRTALVNELQDRLKTFHPVPLAWFGEWTSPSAWDFVMAALRI
jgi:transposase